jgi:hypothetical protein
MMNGLIAMAPSRVDTTDGRAGDLMRIVWMDGVRVYLDGVWVPHCLAYDEGEGEVLIGSAIMRPQLVKGKVRAVPRLQRS